MPGHSRYPVNAKPSFKPVLPDRSSGQVSLPNLADPAQHRHAFATLSKG